MLHGLLERVGNLGVHTIEDLAEFTRRVSPQRRAKRTWASDLPTKAGVYLFVAEHDDEDRRPRIAQVLYVGKSTNLRARVRTYFTAAETRPRMDEMVRLSTGVETIVCDSPLQAEVTELRLIAAHAPPYNRRSKYPERTQWIKITDEAFPRLSIVRAVRDDGATYFGPFHRRQAAEDVVLAIYDGFPIRQCSPATQREAPGERLRPGRHGPVQCAVRRFGLARGVRDHRRAGPDGPVQRRPTGRGRGERAAESAGAAAAVRGGRRHPPAAGHPGPHRPPVPPGPQPGRLSRDRRRLPARARTGRST